MFHLLDEALEAHFRRIVPLEKSIDVSFAMPDRDWSAALTRPTVNAFLWDLKREDKRSIGGVELVPNGEGKTRRLALPRVRVSYFVSAWTGDLRDEHVLLGRLVQALLRSRRIDADLMPAGLTKAGTPLEMTLGTGDTRAARDFWSAVDGRFRPGIDLQIILPVDVGLGTEAGPPTEVIDIRTSDRNIPSRQSQRVRSWVEEPRPESGGDSG